MKKVLWVILGLSILVVLFGEEQPKRQAPEDAQRHIEQCTRQGELAAEAMRGRLRNVTPVQALANVQDDQHRQIIMMAYDAFVIPLPDRYAANVAEFQTRIERRCLKD